MPPLLTLLLPLLPGIIEMLAKLFQIASTAPETPEQLRVHYAKIASDLATVNLLVQNAPEPPPGSGA